MKSKILDQEFDVTIHHLGLFLEKEDKYPMDHYTIRIGDQLFEYHQGIGHRKPKRGYGELLYSRTPSIEYIKEATRIIQPKLDDILYCLVSDSDVMEYSFEEWCNNTGYDPDRISHKKIYDACRENAEKLLKLGIDLEKAREAFQDY